MSERRERWCRELARIHADLAVLDPADAAALIPIGVALEAIADGAPEEPEAVGDTLRLVLRALQSLFEGEAADPTTAIHAARDAVMAAEDALRTPDDDTIAALSQAHMRLERALENGAATMENAPSLDDLAIRLLQTDAGDSDGLPRLAAAMRETIEAGDLCEAARDCLVAAVAALSAPDAEPGDALAYAGQSIEQAMEISDGFSDTVAPEPTADVAPTETALPPDADSALLGEFVTECRELLDAGEVALLHLEANPDDAEAVNTVFRAFHTIKGTAGFLGLTSISEFAHEAETLLVRMRDGEIRCAGANADLALRGLDALKDLVRSVEGALVGTPLAVPPGLEGLRRALRECGPEASPATPAAHPPATQVEPHDAPAPERANRARAQERQEATVRVRMDRLDSLIEMVGELVIAQSMVAQDPAVAAGSLHDLSRKVGHTGKIVRDLQALSLSMRMVPLKPTFQKMARLVRDLAHKSGKDVSFSTEGEDTEIDRNMVDLISDPLVHLIRNAVDHGIETSEARSAAGKPPAGSVRLLAYHASGNVVVEVRDDGRGLDAPKITARAIQRGIIEAGRSMTEREIYDLIFAPGFSTTEQVTEISGRGVGMDVVRRSVESLQGRIEISSEPGHGSTFSLRVPLTLAITDGMLIRVGEERYIIPTAAIHLCFRPEAAALSTVAGRGEMVMLRESLMPVFRLHRLFHVDGAIQDPAQGLLVVIGHEGRLCSLLVDELLGQQQVVAKSLGAAVRKTPGISGGAILGDGRVGLILDTASLVAMAQQADAPAHGTRHARREKLWSDPAAGNIRTAITQGARP